MTAPRIATDIASLRAELATVRSTRNGPLAVVMTMGALHSGHAALLRAARGRAGAVVATIFVNPLQFAANEDLDRYPRTFDDDVAMCGAEGVDLVFAPTPQVMYPFGDPAVRIDPGSLGEILEGASRPGHFAGMLTVVLKLLHRVGPDLAFFGEKDYQQLTLIRRMVRDLDLAVEVVGVPTVREADGLALSSRNRYLDAAQRRYAAVVPTALRTGIAAAQQGTAATLAAARGTLEKAPGIELDYLALTNPDLGPVFGSGPARLLVAARVGKVRLIDNMPVVVGP